MASEPLDDPPPPPMAADAEFVRSADAEADAGDPTAEDAVKGDPGATGQMAAVDSLADVEPPLDPLAVALAAMSDLPVPPEDEEMSRVVVLRAGEWVSSPGEIIDKGDDDDWRRGWPGEIGVSALRLRLAQLDSTGPPPTETGDGEDAGPIMLGSKLAIERPELDDDEELAEELRTVDAMESAECKWLKWWWE